MAGSPVRVVNVRRGTVLVERAQLADSLLGRAHGLLGRATLPPGEDLVIRPCRSVHTYGMAFALDVIHLGGDGHVSRILAGLPARRFGPLIGDSCAVVKLPDGTAAATGTQPGDIIEFGPTPNV